MADEDDGFIGMPPGIFDSGTFKLPPKAERPRTPEREEIVFVPTVPGMPVPAPAEPEVSHETQRAIPDPTDSPYAAPVVPPPSAASAPPAPPAPAPPAPAPAGWRLVLADGSEMPVNRSVIIGRNPADFEAWPGAVLLPVDDTTQSVSKTHAVFEVDDSGLWVHDLNSTNGVWVVHGEDVTEVAPGRRVNVPTGSSVELGDYVLSVRRG
ncbi:FHA domain-containing protein [Protaetiibacter sp. SSC-01]|uniref:FHA domain-containing protein n=1 Tax=Protaetiibacter sp. SSC-01 TaxID=2759943 RepID=UPI001656A12B|nr:FHA domain-containing protein [Protaetiibacter sp. SSC-01]QNO38148.1 FHA domain-containing protein [Protaetiibacter sp. SSC-01]